MASLIVAAGLHIYSQTLHVHPQSLEIKLNGAHQDSIAKATVVVDHGVTALSGWEPGGLTGMNDPEYDLSDFETAAVSLAPFGDAKSEFILGWLCEDGKKHELNTNDLNNQIFKQIDLTNLGLTANQLLAAHWYALSSEHGLGVSSVAMRHLLGKSYYRGDHRKSLALSADYLKKGVAQGDPVARVSLAYSYAYGDGVTTDGVKAWKELEAVINSNDKNNSTYAIIAAMRFWKDEKIKPPVSFSRGAANAAEFARRYDTKMTKQELDDLYNEHGCIPDPYPYFRSVLATKIREDWLANKSP